MTTELGGSGIRVEFVRLVLGIEIAMVVARVRLVLKIWIRCIVRLRFEVKV